LGNTYKAKGDLDSAIREFHEAKRLDPKMFAARQNLASALIAHNMNAEAVVELRELESMAPDSAICHDCLGLALFRTWDFDGAEKEYRKAIDLDPSDAFPHRGLGAIRLQQKNYDEALEEYHVAERLDDTSAPAFQGAGRALLGKKDFPKAMQELKRAEDLKPSDPETHDLYARALEASGNNLGAIAEFKQASALDPSQTSILLELAAALEKSGDRVAALDQYRQAASADHSADTQSQYKAAQQRLNKEIASMKASGNSAEARELKSDLQSAKVTPGISDKLNAAMQAGVQANAARHFDEAEKDYKEAVDLAWKLQPHDDRLMTSLVHLADLYAGRQDFVHADATYQQGLKVTEELHGPQSPMMTEPLQALGRFSLFKRDFNSATDYFSVRSM